MMSETLPQGVNNALNEAAPVAAVDTGAPMYRVNSALKVPVSRVFGKLWRGRVDGAQAYRTEQMNAWDEAIKYYNNNQLSHRKGGEGDKSGNRYYSARRNTQWSETENIVYANVRAMMPALYAKNPQAEFTTTNDALKAGVKCIEHIVNALSTRRVVPGLNLKVHAKQAVLSAELCNVGWIEYGYVLRQQSIVEAQAELDKLSNELRDAKDLKTIRETEGKLMALEETIDMLTPPGAFVRYRPPHDVLVDPDACMADYSDAKWLATKEIYPTDYLNARYGERSDDGTIKSLYEPTHVLLAGTSSEEDDIKNFKLFSPDAEANSYGYATKEALQKAHRTMCWRIWDKTTRRVYLFAIDKWEWPIWAENDPYGLPNFFPLVVLIFNTTPIGTQARSNVVYYLDQQDAINEVHDEFRRARQDVKENVLIDDKFDRGTVEKWLTGSGPNAFSVTVPDGKSMKDMVLEKPNTMLKSMQLFDLQRSMQSIDRISGVSDVLRNVQFKTNTTNKAIENYNSSTALRLDEKIDAIEDVLGDLMYGVGFLCAQFMTAEEVQQLIGERGHQWQQYRPAELMHMFTCQTVGGSTQKPTSQAKQQQALQMADTLTKLAQFAPTVVMQTIFTLLGDAFDELNIPPDAFIRMKEEAVMAMQRGNSTQGAGNGPPTPNTGQPVTPGQPPSGGLDASQMQQIAALIDNLPPEAKLALGKILAKGVPVMDAVPEVLHMMQEQSGNPQQQPTMEQQHAPAQ